YRRVARGCERSQSTTDTRQRDHRSHTLPATPELHRAGFCTRALRRTYRPRRRQRAGAGARSEGLRLDQDGRQRKRSGRPGAVMVTELIKSENSYQAAFRSVRELSPVAPWLELVRASAMERFEQLGFPSVRDEEWKYTNLATLAKESFEPVTSADHLDVDVSRFAFPEAD